MILGVVRWLSKIKSHYFQVNYLINGYLPSILTWYFLIQTKEPPSKFCIKLNFEFKCFVQPRRQFSWVLTAEINVLSKLLLLLLKRVSFMTDKCRVDD